MKAYRLILLAGTLGVVLMVSACDLTTPSQINVSKLKVKDQTVTETYSVDHVDLAQVKVTAHKILRNGYKEIALTVPYLPGGSVAAVGLGAGYKKAFEAQGVTRVSVALVPVTDSRDAGSVVASYQVLTAVQSNDCGRIPGYQGGDGPDAADQYQFGCEMQVSLSKMIADPSDLLGRASPSQADSRRNGPIIEPYLAGTPNPLFTGHQSVSGQ